MGKLPELWVPASEVRQDDVHARVHAAETGKGEGGQVMESNRLGARPAGRPRIGRTIETLAEGKPWLAGGMSRSTWFRRQREARIRAIGLAAVERALRE